MELQVSHYGATIRRMGKISSASKRENRFPSSRVKYPNMKDRIDGFCHSNSPGFCTRKTVWSVRSSLFFDFFLATVERIAILGKHAVRDPPAQRNRIYRGTFCESPQNRQLGRRISRQPRRRVISFTRFPCYPARSVDIAKRFSAISVFPTRDLGVALRRLRCRPYQHA